VNCLHCRRELLQSIIEGGEWMRIEKRRAMPIDRRVFVIKLDVAGPKIRMVSVLVEAENQVPPGSTQLMR